MDKNMVGLGMEIGGIVLGVIVLATLVTQHPVIVVTAVLGAGIYFAGRFIKSGKV